MAKILNSMYVCLTTIKKKERHMLRARAGAYGQVGGQAGKGRGPASSLLSFPSHLSEKGSYRHSSSSDPEQLCAVTFPFPSDPRDQSYTTGRTLKYFYILQLGKVKNLGDPLSFQGFLDELCYNHS